MEKYYRLTKKIQNDDGTSSIQCTLKDTEQCLSIHNDCSKCPIFNAILEHLCAYEDIYTDEDELTK